MTFINTVRNVQHNNVIVNVAQLSYLQSYESYIAFQEQVFSLAVHSFPIK